MKQRIVLSLIAMMGSVFLLIFASFAWFAVSNSNNVDGTDVDVVNLDVEVTLEISMDGVTYVPADNIAIDGAVPGDLVYYRISLDNTGNVPVNVRISLSGFTDQAADANFSYDDTKTLRDVTLVNCSNTVNSETITGQLIADLLPYVPSGDYSNQSFDLASSITLPVSGIGIVYFTLQVSGNAGNDYLNQSIQIARLSIESAMSS
ncbi:MAG TPA: hypothetical protein PLH02_05965 [Bacillota bacterium]|nr:hypothetical protein [Bacillota bacterium]HPF42887.1 hypothetical protein [Bacillota bacterium]HPJ86357.1 hypothetical protein [Bacillota bacterium]HPQ62389.1 hypothetical protein [Bacillota bacterium]HRX92080.1 hypothetical protein [Candidatus Izemoplasmatales bacterium]